MTNHSRDHASLRLVCNVWTQHSVRFSTTRLSISEDCTIEALHYTFNNGFHGLLVDITLRGIRIEHLVVVELVASRSGSRICSLSNHKVVI